MINKVDQQVPEFNCLRWIPYPLIKKFPSDILIRNWGNIFLIKKKVKHYRVVIIWHKYSKIFSAVIGTAYQVTWEALIICSPGSTKDNRHSILVESRKRVLQVLELKKNAADTWGGKNWKEQQALECQLISPPYGSCIPFAYFHFFSS